jgi:hypothetical protein
MGVVKPCQGFHGLHWKGKLSLLRAVARSSRARARRTTTRKKRYLSHVFGGGGMGNGQLHEGFKKLNLKPSINFSPEDFDEFTNFGSVSCATARLNDPEFSPLLPRNPPIARPILGLECPISPSPSPSPFPSPAPSQSQSTSPNQLENISTTSLCDPVIIKLF